MKDYDMYVYRFWFDITRKYLNKSFSFSQKSSPRYVIYAGKEINKEMSLIYDQQVESSLNFYL